MSLSEKIRVAVLYGGRSAEHEVSLRSAANVMQFLDSTQFDIVPIGIDKQGNWLLGSDVFKASLEAQQVKQLDQGAWFTPEWAGKAVPQTVKNELTTKDKSFDVVFPVVHGTLCEDGTLQGLLELAGLPYVGCGVLASAVGMDKDFSKRVAMLAGIPVAPFVVIKAGEWRKHRRQFEEAIQELGFPLFVKPANTGSSVGISRIKSAAQLEQAVNEAFRFDTKLVIEKALDIVELEVAVLEALTDGDEPIVSVVGEIRPTTDEFYSYTAKYVDDNGADLIIPAPLDAAILEKARQVAGQLFKLLDCEGMARIDLFYNKTDGEIYFNEVNTIPGFTKISMYPKLMDASGVTYPALLTHLIKLALKRHAERSVLERNYSG